MFCVVSMSIIYKILSKTNNNTNKDFNYDLSGIEMYWIKIFYILINIIV